jgi:hypothetical protein
MGGQTHRQEGDLIRLLKVKERLLNIFVNCYNFTLNTVQKKKILILAGNAGGSTYL